MNAIKKKIAESALKYIKHSPIIGIGTGTTINYFIKYISTIKYLNKKILYIPSSKITEKYLKLFNLPITNINSITNLPIYIDSADEITKKYNMIKGGGGALTREKIIASFAKKFICIVEEKKIVKKLGKFPVAVEIIPMAKNYVTNELTKLGGIPKQRTNFISDNGNIILDVYNLNIKHPKILEKKINNIPGVIENGIFAKRTANKILIGTKNNNIIEL
ncbi:ribose 5-phosphate isomerase A [Candidatus Legionella polyplacis]|uniref:Ribose-5-phosphate isomerase A n=1 Tax=Candidatus Legionella polyplacis TaxID=2005262 RepID=A0ABZ2GVC6_9GAMM|nr:ribose-5-phosphate isomerase RpiA [Candidatus Legionella polyplacis]ATW01941.1 ribose 5-phosphate isomerase A [Candidatus Legionella polyplacis]